MKPQPTTLPWRAALRLLGPLGLVLSGCSTSTVDTSPTHLAVVFTAVVGIAATLALLHLLLYVFERREQRNLLFTLLAGAFSLVAFLDYRERVDAEIVLPLPGDLQRWAVSALVLAAARFAYSLLGDRAPRRFWWYTAAITLVLLVSIPYPASFDAPAGLLGLAVILDSVLSVLIGHRKVQREAWIVGVGSGIFAVSGFLQLGLDLVGAPGMGEWLGPYLWGGLVLLVSSSIYLARVFARTRHELERRLIEVEELSERTLAQEREAREQELGRRLVEAESERKGRELEEARSLQLAMLPQDLPEVPGFELAARMITATEVGGDYYDATLDDDGNLWLAVGDAVGHGARAGSLVAIAKGLFTGVTSLPSPAAALDRFDAALRGMGLQRAHLALTVGRVGLLDGGRLEIASAGMPPALIVRADGPVEEVGFSTLPLGAPLGQRYTSRRVELGAGDRMLFLTDGLAELPGEDEGPIGYDAVLRAVGEIDPAEGEALGDWVDRVLLGMTGDDTPPDDITVLALRSRCPGAS